MRTKLPERGRSHTAIIDEMRAMKHGDADWQHGRVPLFYFKADDAVYEIGKAGFFEYFSENALGATRAYPSVKRMETEVIDMALDLFGAPADAQGFMTTGGTESIVTAIQACRDWSRKQRGSAQHRGNIVASETAHPAFNKGAKLMDLEVRRAPVGPDLRMDLAAIEALIDDDTIMLVGSAPNFSYGMIDPIAALGAIAERRAVWLHVDACVGGYLAPFVRMIGRAIPDFDFRVPGVSSLSADLHKFGFCPKPSSTVLYRTADKARFQFFDETVWPNGRFLTPTIVGTRPAGGIAGAWATLQFLGVEGYQRIARELMAFVDAYRAGIGAIPGLKILGAPDLSIVAYGSDEFDVFRVAEIMAEKGWLPGLVQRPKGIHRMMSLVHAPVLQEYLDDVRAAVGVVRQSGPATSGIRATY
ncbi:pyridoxal phosphate-dependent decarboxylase family protein [Desertibaculum subflavum]|uniref:pyridoxal phosphate-dependent decarboxylase family protein n=1 Tax=Desertibaculum subflavum TaxID=2268458 RepID=UPI000E675E91